ncbi:Endochitinase [Tetrabaena socialis]|uniref:Endochitinase n=1 Tax=Tetrabaena socialis TaxID=47790 RepID=A0A2J8A0T6_9CHLO|nr:Endochitinase [Tetrabaena socialis]|eukprot:PNH06130.1 Endochitinase [Tetrabaena socialis]
MPLCERLPGSGKSCTAGGGTYTVKSGDTCNAISQAKGISLATLLAANPIINSGCTNLQLGQVLCLGGTSGGTPGGSTPGGSTPGGSTPGGSTPGGTPSGYLDDMTEYCYRQTRDASYCPQYDTCGGPGNNFFGRGPLQLTHCYNYKAMSAYVGQDLKATPALLADNTRDLAWKTALAFWTKPDFNCQGSWVATNPPTCPMAARTGNIAAVTRRINGELECDRGTTPDNQLQRVERVQSLRVACFGLARVTTNVYC